MTQRVYLDHAATTPLSAEVRQAMQEAFGLFGNASSFHAEGRQAGAAIEQARANVAAAVGAELGEIIFTSGGSEANNTVLQSLREFQGDSLESELIVSAIEHPSVLMAAKRLQKRGTKVHYLPVDRLGQVKLSELKKVLGGKTALVSAMMANNEIGTVQNIAEITRLTHTAGALVHTDAVQALGKIPINVHELGVDYATFSAHKIGGPKGVGALYVRNAAPFTPLIVGGHQEGNRRAGTENTLGIVGFGAAAKQVPRFINQMAKTKVLRDDFFVQISIKIPQIVRNGDPDGLPNILNISFAGAEGESILLALDDDGIAVSTGSACASGDTSPSHVLMAIQADPELAHGSIRFSFGPDNTAEDTERVMQALPGIIEKLRAMSTVHSTPHSTPLDTKRIMKTGREVR
ncbi:MAG: cysteine desulfurase [Candidatus Nomurabacteria bacterium]|jgi:cysteine desulfurase|nr:cysteine desulfurase [Candidatus Nomurabacteria bacterium]